jgi:2,5-diketo-D-gluconate reductase A
MADVPRITLSDDVSIPQLGLGVFQVPDHEAADAVLAALDSGYRSIDTAAVYRNERGVGEALARADVPRDDVFVTTKLWNDDQGFDAALQAFEASRERLGLDVVDLYLIHWPCPARDAYVESWRAMIQLRDEGKVRAIGVSNFMREHLQRLLDETGVTPALNQVELHPWLQQEELRAFHAQHGIATEAYSPLAQAQLLDDPVVTGIAGDLDVSPAQVVLRWHIQLGNVVIPKSVTPSRIASNIDVFDFALDKAAMDAVGALNQDARIGPDPRTFC